MFKLLSVGVADSSGAQASYYTSLAVVAYALKYLPTAHHSESDIHEHALGLQMATAFQLLPHIQQCLSALITTDSTNQVATYQELSRIIDVCFKCFVKLISRIMVVSFFLRA